MSYTRSCTLFVLTLCTAAQAWAAALTQPVAPVRPVSTDYFGATVVDRYRYMEDLDDPLVRGWMQAQANYTRQALDALPGRAALVKRIQELSNANVSRSNFAQRGKRYFYELLAPGAQVRKLYYRDGLQGQEKLLLDPALLTQSDGAHYSLDFYEPSPDGRYVAYGVSKGGSEESTLYVLDVSTSKNLPEAIARTSGSVVAWRKDGQSFFYLRYPKITPDMPASEQMYNGRTYLHVLGQHPDGQGDAVVFGHGVSKSVPVPEGQGSYILLSPDSPYALAVANHNMDENPVTLFVAPVDQVRGPNTPWKKLADVQDGVTQVLLRGHTLYFLSHKNAPRFQVLALDLRRPNLSRPTMVLAQGAAVNTDIARAADGLYVRQRDGAASRLLRLSWDGKQRTEVPLPFEGTVAGLLTDPSQAGVLFSLQGWVRAPVTLRYDPVSHSSANTGLTPASPIDTSQLEAKQVFAVSYDGTRVPLSLVYKKGLQRNGANPTILQAYGSYGMALEPRFDSTALAWLERGGIMAVAHVRGGGEYGEDWHRAGQKLTKLNTVFDFIACAQYLADERYTQPKLIAGIGGSAGGITVGGAMAWRPQAFGVILDLVGVSDSLRFETEPNGPPNVIEFGSVKTPEGFHGLHAMSPYQQIRDGVAYPAVMLTTGMNDPRVAPWHATKMAARVQAASASGRPVLLRIDYGAGHGIGSSRSQRAELLADLWAFSLWQMGDTQFQPPTKPGAARPTP